MKELIFKLSESEFIKIITKNNNDFSEADLCCTELLVYFINEHKQILVGQQSLSEIFEPFITCFKKAIGGNLQLHESLKRNLGFMQNQYYQDKTGFIRVPTSNGSSTYWVGFDYEICSAVDDVNLHVSTWLYNDTSGNIILEITKDYPWHFILLDGEPEDLDFVTYDEFMKDYKPLIHRVIPRDVAIAWLEQAMEVYRGFFSSEENYIRACKENNW